ncbi:MAG: hypothetical protein KJ601_03775 [Nanoarchaeota archaeon]|nr:hypothetical protein [Nanoarchaeota archaeon]MBU1705091.1 hypothetical protein [Nanoarchaeota archaeon]
MGKGRPTRSGIRQNIIDILYFMKQGYGYDIYKVYREVFPNVTMRVIYYHLKKGVALGELKVSEIKKEQGNYSWGSTVEKIYYGLGPEAKPIGSFRVKEALERLKKMPDSGLDMPLLELSQPSKEPEQSKDLPPGQEGLAQ